MVLVPRLAGAGSAKAVMPVGKAYWGSTTVDLPTGIWHHLLDGRSVDAGGSVPVATLLDRLPFAVLRRGG